MVDYFVFPGGKKRVVTLSFDDGSVNDERFIKMIDKLGLKATFHLNGRNYVNLSEAETERYRKMYENHEISCHTFSHCWPSRMQPAALVNDVMKDRQALEKIAGYPVLGMSYPNGSYDTLTFKVMESCGIVYARSAHSSFGFKFPDNYLEWHPTCHFSEADEQIEKFNKFIDSKWTNPLLYIWGHSHELRNENDWEKIEKTLSKIAGNDKIWYATNIEIYDYIMAQRAIKISADETIFHNPTSIDVWIEKDGESIIKIPAGQTVKL